MVYQITTVGETKLERVTAYLELELKKDLERLAKAETRSLSQMIVVCVKEAIEKAKQEGKI